MKGNSWYSLRGLGVIEVSKEEEATRDAVRPVTHHQGYRLCTVNANIDGFL